MAKYNRNGYVLYSGPSQLDGEHITVITTGFREPSTNPKTGPMLQTWILRADISPVTAAVNGADKSICGSCPLRTKVNPETGKHMRGCYVQPFQAPRSVWEGYRKGRYRTASSLAEISSLHAGQSVRLGSYGDPAALPFEVLQAIIGQAKTHTAYTHQWRTCDPRVKQIAMASCETPEGQQQASAAGWRTFRVATGDKLVREISCPASEEMGKRTTCQKCGLCNGSMANDPRKHIVIRPHGAGKTFTLSIVK